MSGRHTVRQLTDHEIAELDAPLTALVDQITERNVESQERFRQLVVGPLANTLTAVARARLRSRFGLKYDDAREKASEAIAKLVSPGSRFVDAWTNAKRAIAVARERGERPRLVIVRHLKRTVYDICSDEMRHYRRTAGRPVDQGIPAPSGGRDGYSEEEVDYAMASVSALKLSQSEDLILRLRVGDQWSFASIAAFFETTHNPEFSNADIVKRAYHRIVDRFKAQYLKRDAI